MEIGISKEKAAELIRRDVTPVTAGILRTAKAEGRILSEDLLTEEGEVILSEGMRLTKHAMGVLKAAGLDRPGLFLPVYKPVRCAVLSVGPDAGLAEKVEAMGYGVTANEAELPADADKLADAVYAASDNAEAIFLTGGLEDWNTSVVPQMLSFLFADLVFRQDNGDPAGPAVCAIYRGRPLLAFSGDPAQAAAALEAYGRPALAARSGCAVF